MKIYVGHSRDIDYAKELYRPIREFEKDTNHVFLLPHEKSNTSSNDRNFYNEIDLFIAEVSMPATGLGIELGWAYDNNVPIVCIFKKGKKISGSLNSVTNNFYEYENTEELKNVIELIIENEKNKNDFKFIR